jgi:hypothetical protein
MIDYSISAEVSSSTWMGGRPALKELAVHKANSGVAKRLFLLLDAMCSWTSRLSTIHRRNEADFGSRRLDLVRRRAVPALPEKDCESG